jgi:hypothetical protein
MLKGKEKGKNLREHPKEGQGQEGQAIEEE